MFCRKCGKLIPDDSVFCAYCGETVIINPESSEQPEQLSKLEGPAEKEHGYCSNCGGPLPQGKLTGLCTACFEQIGYDPYEFGKCEECGGPLDADDKFVCKKCLTNNNEPQHPQNFYASYSAKPKGDYSTVGSQSKRTSGCLTAALVCAGLIVVIGIIIGSISKALPTAANEAVSAVAESSSAPLSVRQQSILSAYDTTIKSDIEDTIKRQLKHPATATITHDTSQLTANNAIFTDRGSVSYTNAKGKSVKEDFTVSVIATDKVYYSLYMQLGKTVFEDSVKGVNSLGIATAYGKQIFNIPDGNPIFKGADGTIILITDEERQKMSMTEYSKIETGMTYAQVTEIVGSYGEEHARTNVADYETVIMSWQGNGVVGSNANVTFQNGKVIAKAQMGLE